MPQVKSAEEAERITIAYAKRKYEVALIKLFNTTLNGNHKWWLVEIGFDRTILLVTPERHIIAVDLDGNVKSDKPVN